MPAKKFQALIVAVTLIVCALNAPAASSRLIDRWAFSRARIGA